MSHSTMDNQINLNKDLSKHLRVSHKLLRPSLLKNMKSISQLLQRDERKWRCNVGWKV